MKLRTVRTYQDGYTIACDDSTDLYHCLHNDVQMVKKDSKSAAYKNLTLAEKFIKSQGALEIEKPAKPAWTRPAPVEIAPLEEQLAALPPTRFVVIEKHISIYKERGYGVYDREQQEIVCPHTYNGINFLSRNREDAEKEAEYCQDHPPVKVEIDKNILSALVEIEDAWEHRFSQPQSEPVPAPFEETEVVIDTREDVGTIIEFNGKKWLVAECDHLSQREVDEAEEGFDVFLRAGWQSTLVRLDTKIMEVIAGQYRDGQVRFLSSQFVQFADEAEQSRLTDLAYSAEIGLYDKTKVSL